MCCGGSRHATEAPRTVLGGSTRVVPEDKLYQQLTGSKACMQSMRGLLGCSLLLVDTERVQALPGTLQSAEDGW